MKFNILPIGQTFELDGQPYVKISPLVAEQRESGQRKLVRRAADVLVAQETPASEPANKETLLPAQRVLQALDAYEAVLNEQLRQHEPALSAGQPRLRQDMMDNARQAFLQAIGLAGKASPVADSE